MLEHVKHPRNMGKIADPDFESKVINTSCGDNLTLYIKLANSTVTDVKYEANACAITIASASMLSESLYGKSISEIKKINEDDILANFYGSITPSRKKCAFLVLEAIKNIDEKAK